MPHATETLDSLEGVTAKELAALRDAQIHTYADLLWHLPKRYEDRRRFQGFPQQAGDGAHCLRGIVVDVSRRGGAARGGWFEAVLLDSSTGAFGGGKITCRWFNMPFIHRWIACGQELVVFGRLKEQRGRLLIDHPEFEVLVDEGSRGDSPHLERIVPVYRQISGLSQRRLREMLFAVQQLNLEDGLALPLPDSSGAERLARFRQVHFPLELAEAERARRAFAFEEFFALQLQVAWRKRRQRERSGRVLGRKTQLLTAFYRSLPYDLTAAQKRTIREILADMRQPCPMRRLLQGDVGSGKTLVALSAMLLAVDSGCQAVLMAPTQILAEQHYLTFRRYLDGLGVRMGLRTGTRDEGNWESAEGVAPQIVIGTHALLHEQDRFEDVGFVVIDEQHKFGVDQREALVRKGISPDVLYMTATPIPRTLTLTLYGDMELSILDEKPPGRGRVITALRVAPKQNDVTAFVRGQLEQGRQAYLVYPLVEESESSAAESAVEAHRKWTKRLAPHVVGLLHGKMRPDEKDAVMQQFRAGEVAALVSTTVVEVGVDVPNATVMLLHHAERFGLAQLHQLRGRVGRGGGKGYCILLTDGKSEEGMEKLRVVESTSDGFEIAEADLKLRGPGTLLGSQQSGLGELTFAEYLTDHNLLREARELAERVMQEDSELVGAHAGFAAWLGKPYAAIRVGFAGNEPSEEPDRASGT